MNPTIFESHGQWYCQSTINGLHLVSGVGDTEDEATKRWKEEVKQVEKEIAEGQKKTEEYAKKRKPRAKAMGAASAAGAT